MYLVKTLLLGCGLENSRYRHSSFLKDRMEPFLEEMVYMVHSVCV